MGAAAEDTAGAVATGAEAEAAAEAEAEVVTAMIMVAANDAMAAPTGVEEEVLEAIDAAVALQAMVEIEGVVAMAPAADIAAAAATTTSRHTVFKARWLSIF